MDEASIMTQVSKIDLGEFNPEMSFSITLDKFKDQNNNKDNLSIDLISNDLKSRLEKKDITDSVMNLTQCFICLSIAENPLSCPKCNNFACKECLKTYFGNGIVKDCPLCKNKINKKELRKNKIIKEIEKIIYKEDTKSNKIEKLAKLVNEKKKMWENQEQYLNDLINKVVQYQENLKEYRSKYELYFLRWKEKINETFRLYEKKIEELIDLLIKYKQKYNNDLSVSIERYNKIKEKNSFSKKDINSLVNEILTMERNYFNVTKNLKEGKYLKNYSFDEIVTKSKEFFITPILMMPNISNYNIETLYISKKDFKKGSISKKDYNVHLGYYQIQHLFDIDNYTSTCKLYIKNDKDVSFFPIQKKVIDSKFYEIIPMRDISDYTHYIFDAKVDFHELKDEEKPTIRIETKIQIFSVIG